MALSRDSEKCCKCEFYDECCAKRMEMCGYLTLPEYSIPTISVVDILSSSMEQMNNYRAVQEGIERELYKSLGCGFLKEDTNGSSN